jgi:hypothetical protein
MQTRKTRTSPLPNGTPVEVNIAEGLARAAPNVSPCRPAISKCLGWNRCPINSDPIMITRPWNKDTESHMRHTCARYARDIRDMRRM